MPAHAQRMRSLLAADKEVAALNMPDMVVTLEVSKLRSWLNADARENIQSMAVTLEVSKLSGWLNAYAYCRESKEGHAVRGEVYGSGGSRRWTTATQVACTGESVPRTCSPYV